MQLHQRARHLKNNCKVNIKSFWFTCQISSSLCCRRGSKLLLTVPSNRVGSCGIMLNLDLKSCKPNLQMFTPSIIMLPSDGSITLKSAWMRVDLPLPVRPTTPIFFFPRNVQVTPFRIIGRLGLYLTWRLLSSIVPVIGHSGSGLQFSIINGASLAMRENCKILSTEIILFSTLHMFHITQAWSTFRLRPYVAASPARPEVHF